MKNRIFACIPAVVLLLAGCNKPAATTSTEPKEPETPKETPTPAPTPKPAPVVESKPAPLPVEPKVEAPPPKALAPEGTLFAVQRISVTTDDGIHAVSAGTRLKIVRKTGTGFVVTDGKREFTAEPHQVTNELQTAASAAQADQVDRSAIAVAQQAQAGAQAQLLQTQQQQDAIAQQDFAKDKRLRDLEARSLSLTQEDANLTAKIADAQRDAERARFATDYLGRVATRTIDPNLKITWQTRLGVVKEEKRKVEMELNRLRYGSPYISR